MKGSAQIIKEPQHKIRTVGTMSRNAWPFEILEGRHKGRLAFIFNHKGRKQVCYLDTLCRDSIESLIDARDPKIRPLEEGETIELTVSS